MEKSHIQIGHGSGGSLSGKLIREIFLTHFDHPELARLGDSAVVPFSGTHLACTTDSFVVDPLFFPGGDIGKLAVCGTLNDLAMAGATPLYLTCGMIIEEGFEIEKLEKIVSSMAAEARKMGVHIVAGDTKVVKRGQADKIFINTSGTGLVPEEHLTLNQPSQFCEGDRIILTGSLGDHAITILAARENLELEDALQTDAACLFPLCQLALKDPGLVRTMRDITRGGLATVLAELCAGQSFGFFIDEKHIPVRQSVQSVCELFGFDPLYLANEGKMLLIVDSREAGHILSALQSHPLGREAAIIGSVTTDIPGKVGMRSLVGGTRIVDMLAGEMLPRIC